MDAQFPQWRGLAIKPADSQGTVNAIFRIGGQFAARFALEPGDPGAARPHLESEARAARALAGRTRFRTPEPVALSEPGAGYPLAWLVQTWLPGVTATDEDPGGSATFAHDVGEFISGVRCISTDGRTFSVSGRGGGLACHDPWMQTCFTRSGHLLDVPRLRRMWDIFRELPCGAGGDVMSHGDLIPGNVLVSGGQLAGVLDVGGLRPADPALDLVAAWHLLEVGPRQVFRHDLGCDDLDWERGKTLAFEQAMGAIWYYADSNLAMSGWPSAPSNASRQTHRQPDPADHSQRRPEPPAPDPPI